MDKRIRPHLRSTNDWWRVDETYIKVKGRWKYLYRAILIKQRLSVESDSIFETALVRACGYWMLNTLTRHFEPALRKDLNWGISTTRQQILARLEAFITTAQEFSQLPGLSGTTSKLLERLRQQWSNVPDLPLYPAFQKK